jgi:adsorption protein B
VWVLTSGLDDLFVTAVFLLRRRATFRWPSAAELDAAPHRRTAIFVPLWREHAVIGAMLEHNHRVIRYDNYDFFAGVYPNDSPTCNAVSDLQQRIPNLHVVVCPHDGPTSKADCLNWIYRGMVEYERRRGSRFERIVTHDAEDLIHPDSLALIDFFGRDHDMVQIPVLPLATPLRQFIHGIYCDEFAEYQTKDIPVRQAMGGFLPSNGVGAGFSREVLEELEQLRGGSIFDATCLTEDYEHGFRVYCLGRRQMFVPLRRDAADWTATREYFPRRFRTAVRQRSRWVTGISLQGWERHGWFSAPGNSTGSGGIARRSPAICYRRSPTPDSSFGWPAGCGASSAAPLADGAPHCLHG